MRALAIAIMLAAIGVPSAVAAQFTASASGSYLVFFDWGRPELSRDSQATLGQVARTYAQTKPTRVLIIGHADLSGPASVNLRASRRRANAVRAYLASHGVPHDAMTVTALGEAQPIVPTEDGVRDVQNRRVEIIFR